MVLFLACSIRLNKTLAKSLLKKAALDMGFNDVRITRAKPLPDSEKKYLEWREKGYAGEMSYLLRDEPINARANELFEGAKTIIIFTVSYYSEAPPRPSNDHGKVANYAVGLDYHKVIKKKLKELIKKLNDIDFISKKCEELNLEKPDEIFNIFQNSRVFTDSVPLMEKSYAKKAGLGFKGKNTLLISRETGSFNFIAEIVTDIDFDTDESESYSASGTCGACIRCQDICPTNALVGDHQIDATKCISYLNIETKSLIDKDLMPNMGEWVFGCDLCQTICPYNKKQSESNIWEEFKPESGLGHWLYLPEILEMDHIHGKLSEKEADDIFHKKFCRTPLSRPKRKGMIRNAIITAANSGSEKSKPLIEKYINHEDKVLRETAKWAIESLL